VKGLVSSGAMGALSASSGISAMGQASSHPNYRFGVQLNAFPIDPKNFSTFLSALADVKRIGYDGFESGFRNVSEQFSAPDSARRQIEATGLTFFGVHIFLNAPMYDSATTIAPTSLYESVGRGAAPLGAHHLILSGAPAKDLDQLNRKIEALNRAGGFAKSVGLRLAYHNHWPEFESKIGEI
jgi:inosose dehydratase